MTGGESTPRVSVYDGDKKETKRQSSAGHKKSQAQLNFSNKVEQVPSSCRENAQSVDLCVKKVFIKQEKLMETIHGALPRIIERELVSVGTVDINSHIQHTSAIAARVEQPQYA
jgi:hypothetical protein